MARALIVTGMHRSGTSLVASLFDHAGVNLGTQLLAPKADNPFGFFEDLEFLAFHEAALHARGQTILVTRDFVFAPTAAETERGRALAASRNKGALWGWKDPRTSLFLEFWNTLVPDAQYLLVYRHPVDVMLSLARRGEVVGFDFFSSLDAWYVYNDSILQFAQAHPHTTLVCSSYALVKHVEEFKRALAERFGLSLALSAETRDAIFRQEHLRKTPPTREADALLRQIHPQVFALYDALQTCAVLKESEAAEVASTELTALAAFAEKLATPLSEANRRALLTMLVAQIDPVLYETFAQTNVTKTNQLEAQRRAWEATAEERAHLLREQTAWAEPRMKDLQALEANPLVRALKRFGLV